MPLDSDVNNADSQLHVEFYEHKDEPYKGKPFVRIVVPGDKTNVIDQPVKEYHKSRFPRQWLYFQMKNSGDQVVGTMLEAWNQAQPLELTTGQMEELQILKFRTVEQVATASDAQLQRVGMGAVGIRERARTYLASKNQTQTNHELVKTQNELAELKAQMAQFMAGQTATSIPKKRGPKPGFKKAKVNVQHDDAATHATGHE